MLSHSRAACELQQCTRWGGQHCKKHSLVCHTQGGFQASQFIMHSHFGHHNRRAVPFLRATFLRATFLRASAYHMQLLSIPRPTGLKNKSSCVERGGVELIPAWLTSISLHCQCGVIQGTATLSVCHDASRQTLPDSQAVPVSWAPSARQALLHAHGLVALDALYSSQLYWSKAAPACACAGHRQQWYAVRAHIGCMCTPCFCCLYRLAVVAWLNF